MAIVSKPIWSPNPVPALPACTIIEFDVIPGVFADAGIVVEYVLHSEHGEYQAETKPPALSTEEEKGSDPTTPNLQPNKRGRALIVVRYRGALFNTPFHIKRALCLSKTPGGTPGLSSITVTVSDVQSNGVATDPFVQSAMIGL